MNAEAIFCIHVCQRVCQDEKTSQIGFWEVFTLANKINGAGGGSRTLTELPPPDFESGASAISPLRQEDGEYTVGCRRRSNEPLAEESARLARIAHRPY